MDSNNKKTSVFDSNKLSSTLLFMWLSLIFVLTGVRFVLSRIGLYSGIAREIILWLTASIPLIIFFANIRKIEIKKYFNFFILILIVFVAMTVSILFNPDLIEFYFRKNYGIDRILRPDSAIFAFLFFQLFDDQKEILDVLLKFSILYFLFLILVELVPAIVRGFWLDIGPNGEMIKLSYSLSFGYNMTFPTIMFIYNFGIKGKKIYLFLAILGCSIIFLHGNRGAILVTFLYICLMFLSLSMRYTLSKKLILIISLSLIAGILIYYYEPLINYLTRVLSKKNIISRNFELLLSGDISNNNGRYVIWNTVVEAIKNGPLLGYGILGDRPFIYPIHYVGYSHNIVLEMIVSFGLLGFLIILYMIVDSIYMIFFCKDRHTKDLFIILFSISSQLFLSMSFWYVWGFWATFAVSCNYKRIRRKNCNNDLKKRLNDNEEICNKIKNRSVINC
ncbi:O-antigen ligase family protein [Lagierella sp.]|uniref:O-antigen ligase family protein n=1 Tax=Lagierella sp. TaxID=2849657 RepID=UPI00260FE157|nr:O-antigen ligase family protein [Lagierella sp.]